MYPLNIDSINVFFFHCFRFSANNYNNVHMENGRID